jgi:Transcriptional regulator containing an amidase domain and an AraC-type DNA-binding HTH domain
MMKNLFEDSYRPMPARNKTLHIGLLLWPNFSLLALSGLMEALRTASSVQKCSQKIAFNLSLISVNPDLPITSSAGISVQPEVAYATPGAFDYIAVIGGSLEYLEQGYSGDRMFLAEAHHSNIPLIGIGSGSFILAEEGVTQ